MPPDLDELAQRGQKTREHNAAQTPHKKKAKSEDRDSPECVYERSFVGDPPKRVWVPLLALSLGVLGGTIVILHDGHPQWLQDASGLLWTAVVGAWLVIIFAWRSVAQTYMYSESAWQAALPFAFDAESYKETLSRRAGWTRCIVVVETNDTNDKTNDSILAALHGANVEKVLMRRAGAFEVRSIKFDTTVESEEFSGYSNVRLHQWFKAYAQDVLIPLHAVGLVRKVRVESQS